MTKKTGLSSDNVVHTVAALDKILDDMGIEYNGNGSRSQTIMYCVKLLSCVSVKLPDLEQMAGAFYDGYNGGALWKDAANNNSKLPHLISIMN